MGNYISYYWYGDNSDNNNNVNYINLISKLPKINTNELLQIKDNLKHIICINNTYSSDYDNLLNDIRNFNKEQNLKHEVRVKICDSFYHQRELLLNDIRNRIKYGYTLKSIPTKIDMSPYFDKRIHNRSTNNKSVKRCYNRKHFKPYDKSNSNSKKWK